LLQDLPPQDLLSESLSDSLSESLSDSLSESLSDSLSESLSDSLSESLSDSLSESYTFYNLFACTFTFFTFFTLFYTNLNFCINSIFSESSITIKLLFVTNVAFVGYLAG